MNTNGNGKSSPIPVDIMTAWEILRRNFTRPEDILECQLLDAQGKRSILASCASDRYSVESAPEFRHPAQLPTSVRYRDTVEALKALDRIGSRRPGGALS
ncbi:hypothetical protein DTW90_28990 [Neorhizobium sp. P12A]|uniref:hypothetical protein n=1 Tax=Rhizobium/Agrobacterium group TaxID=227290 RepID=UPI0010463F7C|nr:MULTISPECIES: hypothetical protein [Rhizobium/Agrobacterium group]KAA0690938.1 hypothetical protein DTW90_28990 [Neorhizobium sp. P12A]TCR65935.1 hypothetical protein EV561_15715 [Rhizobium sp. BK376]